MTSQDGAERPLGVVIADDDERVRVSLAELIDDDPGLRILGCGAFGDEAAALCAIHHPPLAVIDVIMPTGGVQAIAAILAVSPSTRVMAFTARADRRTCERLVSSGAGVVVAKGSETDLAATLHALASSPEGRVEPRHRSPT